MNLFSISAPHSVDHCLQDCFFLKKVYKRKQTSHFNNLSTIVTHCAGQYRHSLLRQYLTELLLSLPDANHLRRIGDDGRRMASGQVISMPVFVL